MGVELVDSVAQDVVPISMDPVDRALLVRSLAVLDGGAGLFVRVADLMGGALGRTVRLGARTLRVAPGLEDRLQGVAAMALRRAFDIAVLRLPEDGGKPREGVSRAVVMMSGAVGGFLGMGGFVPDAAVTTLTIMREIARAAQEAGESLSDEDTRRACIGVFGLTPGSAGEGASELGYLSARFMIQGSPLVLLLSEVAARYGVSLSQKFALQSVPIIGAMGGAAVNSAFLLHYRGVARAQFAVRGLERRLGGEAVAREIASLRGGTGAR